MEKLNFIHIPKCGGTTVRKLYNKHFKAHWWAHPYRNKINFAVIRNPYSRIQSCFAYLKESLVFKNSTSIQYFSTLHDLATAYFDNTHPQHRKAQVMFHWTVSKLKNKPPQQHSGPFDNVDSNGSPIHFAPQTLFIHGWNDYPVLLLRLEFLAQDLQYFINSKQLPPPPNDINSNYIMNKSSGEAKALAKITPIVEKLVRIIYKQDIELYERVYGHPAQILY